MRIYGGDILSSPGETIYALESDVPERLPYDVRTLLQTPYIIDHFQEQYFVIQSYEQLFHSVPEIETTLEDLLQITDVRHF